jgi:DNA-binding NtrC family response regulator
MLVLGNRKLAVLYLAPGADAPPSCDGADVSSRDIQQLQSIAQRIVGVLGLSEAQRVVRHAMFEEALRRSHRNRHDVARVLHIDRRYVRKLIKDHPELDANRAQSTSK